MKRSASLKTQLVVLFLLFVTLGGLAKQHQAIQDWLRLRGYTAPANVVTLASDDTMTDKARHLFYVNRPVISGGNVFTKNCPAGTEKTVVLGCYVGNDAGIYLYDVTDERLSGVEQVTAAHETLHAAYRRLSDQERTDIDAKLIDYYQHTLTDQRIKDTIASYKKSEPNDVVNEMHSIFGTEIPNLPPALEKYYKQYFTDRAKITGYTARYQGEFTSRQNQIKTYDSQLLSMKRQIDTNTSELAGRKTTLDAEDAALQRQRSSGDLIGYNDAVVTHNAAVIAYNNLLNDTKGIINQYNIIVNQRNDVALEEQQLTAALSASSLPADK